MIPAGSAARTGSGTFQSARAAGCRAGLGRRHGCRLERAGAKSCHERPPPTRLKIALAQLNPTVGDVAGNADKVRAARAEAAGRAPTSSCSPSCSSPAIRRRTWCSSPRSRPPAARRSRRWRARRATAGRRCSSALPWAEDGKLYNAYALLAGGRDRGACASRSICRTTACSTRSACSRRARCRGRSIFRGVRIGMPICEDIWGAEVVECLAETGGEILLVPNGSPYWRGKTDVRLNIAVARVVESGLPLRLSQPGRRPGRARLRRRLVRAQRRPRARRPAAGLPRGGGDHAVAARRRGLALRRRADGALLEEGDEADYAACVLGLRDYVDKNGFTGVVLGLSGGINSALCAAMAVDALGAERVRCVMLPYRYTSQESLDDAAGLRQGARRALRRRADRARGEGLRGGARAAVRRPAARRDRGESAGARPRHDPDGDLQQVRRRWW